MDWSKFDADAKAMEELRKEVEDMGSDSGGKKEVPVGEYEVTITKVEMKESKTGKPMVSVWMKIITGAYKGQLIFYNQLIDRAFGIHLIKQFFAPFNLLEKLSFESYSQFSSALENVRAQVNEVEFALSYTFNEKGFAEYKVMQIFEI